MNQAAQIDSGTRNALQQMVSLARQGRREEARKVGKAALPKVSDTAPLHAFLGRLACECGDFQDGIVELKAALQMLPDELMVRCDLAAALIQIGDFRGAIEVSEAKHMHADRSLQLARMRGYAAQQLEQWPDAIETYQFVVDRMPDDVGSLNNLANAMAAQGDVQGAIKQLRRAAQVDPQAAPTRLNLATWLAAAGESEEAIEVLRRMATDFPDDAKPLMELARVAMWSGQDPLALEALEEAAKRQPQDPQIQIELGQQRRSNWDFSGAENAFRAAIAADPRFAGAFVSLADLYEHDNRPAELPELVDLARSRAIDPSALALVEAYAHRRAKEWEQGLAAAERAAAHDSIRRFQLIGQFKDRLDDPVGAFAAFEEMNRLVTEQPRRPLQQAGHYRNIVDRNLELMTSDWLESWTPAVTGQPGERAWPAFLTGFPRSGTTLLDTMLMGHPGVQVMEERPPLTDVEHRVGGVEALPSLKPDDVRGARDDYWREVAKHIDLRPGTLVIDKGPLYVNKTAVIHRLFPNAKFILALRHPMDVVLSCFITNFRPNPAMANFLELRRAAELYDRSMAAFEKARQLIDLQTFTVCYERMVADRDAELKPLFDWLQLDWREDFVNHQATAAKRGTITTASYAQVHEPLYTRAAGRWTRYAEQLEPVRDILEPWVERFGYSLDDPAKLPERKDA